MQSGVLCSTEGDHPRAPEAFGRGQNPPTGNWQEVPCRLVPPIDKIQPEAPRQQRLLMESIVGVSQDEEQGRE